MMFDEPLLMYAEEEAPQVHVAPGPAYSFGAGAALSPVTVLIGMIGLLGLLWIIGESSKTDIQPAHIKLGGYNLVAVTIASSVGILLLKLFLNKWPIPHVTDLVNAI